MIFSPADWDMIHLCEKELYHVMKCLILAMGQEEILNSHLKKHKITVNIKGLSFEEFYPFMVGKVGLQYIELSFAYNKVHCKALTKSDGWPAYYKFELCWDGLIAASLEEKGEIPCLCMN